MFFPLSKLVFFAITPSNLLILVGLLGAGLIFAGRVRIGRWLVLFGLTGLLVAGLSPLSIWVARPLEERFPPFAADARPVAGIVVLGGAIETRLSLARHRLTLNDAGERQIAMADLARRYPEARIVFSGGSGNLRGDGGTEADVVSKFADGLALPRTRLILEDRSRNTHENAAFTAALVKPRPDERWLLVTSAWHMPRAIGCFRTAGFDVTAYPVDYRTGSPADGLRFASFASEGLALLDLVVKEWVGLVAYRMAGYTDAWLPAPQDASEAGPSR